MRVSLLLVLGGSTGADSVTICENRRDRDVEIEPGGLELVGVKSSPLGDFPQTPAANSREHFFHQLRRIWTDDCHRVMVQMGLASSSGPPSFWSDAAIWLRYFNHSGRVVVTDQFDTLVAHFEEEVFKAPIFQDLGVRVQAVQMDLGTQDGEVANTRRDSPLSLEELVQACSTVPPSDPAVQRLWQHPCERVRRQLSGGEAKLATSRTFDDLWEHELRSTHVDVLRVEQSVTSKMLREGFEKILTKREVSVVTFRVDRGWTKDQLRRLVEWLDSLSYLSLVAAFCDGASGQVPIEYQSGNQDGPLAYLPLSGIDFDEAIPVFDKLILPQDLIVLDMKQPDLFRTIQFGDQECGVDEDADVAPRCEAGTDGEGKCSAKGSEMAPPHPPEDLWVAHTDSRALRLGWRPPAAGPAVAYYRLRVNPGKREEAIDHVGAPNEDQRFILTALSPNTKYKIEVSAANGAGSSEKMWIEHTTGADEKFGGDSRYDLREGLHCGMGSAEEVAPAGPPPGGMSFFQGTTLQQCQLRCEENRQCVAFQVKDDALCWLYRQRPQPSRLEATPVESGWYCGVRNSDS